MVCSIHSLRETSESLPYCMPELHICPHILRNTIPVIHTLFWITDDQIGATQLLL